MAGQILHHHIGIQSASVGVRILDADLCRLRLQKSDRVVGSARQLLGHDLHFIDQTRTRGGHIRDFELARGQIAISISSDLHLSLPRSGPFLDATLSPEGLAEQIHTTEGC